MNRGIALNTTKFSVMDASKAFKKSRTTIYEALKNGEISRDSDGLIDLSELIRVYGNPSGVQSTVYNEHVHKESTVHIKSEVETLLKDQISLLKNQLDLANQREKSLMQHIEDLTHRIEFKGNLEQKNEVNTETEHELSVENLTVHKSKKTPVPEHIEPEKKKKGFWSKFFQPND